MAYPVSSDYITTIYSGETKNKIKIKFNNVEYLNFDEILEKVTIKSKVMKNGSNIFSLEDFVSKEIDMILIDYNPSTMIGPVEIEIGTMVNNSYEWVKIGVFDINGAPTTNNGKTTFKLRDYSARLDVKYNAKEIIDNNGGKSTLRQILNDIGNKCNVVINVPAFPNENIEVGIYDNTINARQYVSWLASQGGLKPIINRDGELEFINLKNQLKWTIPLRIIEKYTIGTPFEVSKVVYEDGIRRYESGNNTKDTLFIDTKNVYISNQEQIDEVLNKMENFKIDSLKTGKVLGNPAIDPWDLIEFVVDDKTYTTLANNTLIYNGVFINTFDTEIGEKERTQNVTFNGEATFKKWATTNIDNLNGEIQLLAGEITSSTDSMSSQVANMQIDVNGVKTTISETNTTIEGLESQINITETTVEGLKQSIEKKGGNNLLENSVKQFSNAKWNGSWTNLQNTETMTELLSPGALQPDDEADRYDDLTVPNGTYILSFKYKKTIQLATMGVEINGHLLELTEMNTWTNRDYVFEVTDNTILLTLASDTKNSGLIGDLGVYTGNIIAPWSPNPNEVHTGTVKIGGDTISIESSTANTKWVANPDGSRVFNRSTNEVVREDTDKGTWTKHIEARTGQISKVAFEEISETQTGVVRI